MMILLVSALLCGAFAYCLLTVLAAKHYLSVRPRKNLRREPISILKPLSGLDPDLESNLRTFFEQDYARFEILFAARREDDPAVGVARRLCAGYPGVRSQVLITGEPPYPNAKVYSLDHLIEAAENDLVVMSDSDTRVTPEFLE